jgi:MoaA/NifB/PqqE/SkfB family radical SAM enzyme
MTYADIKVGYSCNNNCVHCVIADKRRRWESEGKAIDLSTEGYKKEILKARNEGISEILFTGGEPTVRKDIFSLVGYARGLGLGISMQTNGRMFYYEEYCKRMCAIAGIYYVIALHGSKAEIHDKITQKEGSFRQTLGGMKNLIKMGQSVNAKVVISKINMGDLTNIAKLCGERGVKRLDFAFPHALGNAWQNFDKVVPRYSEIKEEVHRAAEFCIKNNIKVDFEAIPFCFMEGYEETVGDVVHVGEGGIYLKSLYGEVMDWTVARKQIKTKFGKCKRCKYDNVCEGVWKEYPIRYGDEEFA